MPPACAIICLILGLAALVLFIVGFSLPFWFSDTLQAGTTANHGLWQSRVCQKCDIQTIGFGVSAEFEAARVFACATVAMGIVAFIFAIVFVNRPTKTWSIRCSAVWGCTALFNLLAVSLFGGTESKTLDELKLGVSTSDIGFRLGWGFWAAVVSLLLFVLLALNCAFLTCSRDVQKDDQSESGSALKRKRFFPKIKKMQADHMTKLYIEATKPQRTAGLYPDIGSYPAPSYPASTLTTKTANAFPPAASTYTSNGPSVYTVNKTSKGYSIQPSSAAVNIDNRNPQLNALGTYGYRSNGVSTYNQGASVNPEQDSRVILNRPDLTSYASTTGGVPANLSLPRQGTTYQDNPYSFNVNPRVNPQSSYPPGFVVAGPPGYASLPHQERRNVVANFGTSSTTNVPYGVY